MMKSSYAILFFLFASAAFAQETPPPVIASVNPPAAPASGGTLVTITGTGLGLPPNFSCFAPCPSRVTFGDTTVTVRTETNTELTLVTPPHAPGTVDLKVTTGDNRTTTLPNGFIFTASSEANYQRILLPIYLEVKTPGSNGSLWQSDLWLRNHGTETVPIAPWPCPGDEVCPAVFPLTKTLAPNESLHNLTPFFRLPPAIPGRVIFLGRNGAADVDVQLRISDISRNVLDAGTELPVVRDEELKTSTAHLLNVPLDPAFRLTLRVYDVTPSPSSFVVRVYEMREGVDASVLLVTNVVATSPETGEFRDLPSYGEIGDLAAQLPAGTAPRALRIEVEPKSPGSRFWAFVSITNNATQHVTLVTPQ